MEHERASEPGAADAERDGRRGPSLTEYALVAAVMCTIGVMAVPQRATTHVELSERSVTLVRELQGALHALRGALLRYREEHDEFPGYAGRPGTPERRLSELGLRAQLAGWSDADGNASFTWKAGHDLGPYLLYGVPENPINRMKSVRLVADDEAFPAAPDVRTGWIFKPSTGELRANCEGAVPGTELALFDL